MRKLFFIGFVCMGGLVLAQGQPDSILLLEDYLAMVRSNHPTATRAGLLTERANAMLLEARGGFDPEIYLDYRDKQFDNTPYYQVGEAGFRLPTTIGLELQAGYRWANGDLLNPENKQPSVGQTFFGLNLPLLQGLFTDNNRIGLRRAALRSDWNEQSAILLRNDLLYDASLAYLNWVYTQRQLEILRSSLELTETRLRQTVASFEVGDLAAIDTLETYVQLVNRRAEIQAADAQERVARLAVEQELWLAGGQTVAVDPDARALSMDAARLHPLLVQDWTVAALASHPALAQLSYQQQDLRLEERLKRQKLLPKLDLKYQFLANGLDFTSTAPSNGENTTFSDILLQDNSWGIGFQMPLFFRAARGDLQLNIIKQQETDLYRQEKARELENKLRQYLEQLRLLEAQRDLLEQNVNNYRLLLEAEQIDFRLGASSVFLLNSRENKLLEAELKLAKVLSDLLKVKASLRWVAGAWR